MLREDWVEIILRLRRNELVRSERVSVVNNGWVSVCAVGNQLKEVSYWVSEWVDRAREKASEWMVWVSEWVLSVWEKTVSRRLSGGESSRIEKSEFVDWVNGWSYWENECVVEWIDWVSDFGSSPRGSFRRRRLWSGVATPWRWCWALRPTRRAPRFLS